MLSFWNSLWDALLHVPLQTVVAAGGVVAYVVYLARTRTMPGQHQEEARLALLRSEARSELQATVVTLKDRLEAIVAVHEATLESERAKRATLARDIDAAATMIARTAARAELLPTDRAQLEADIASLRRRLDMERHNAGDLC